MTIYDGDFKAGEVVKINGTPLHNGETGTVVEWRKDWGDQRSGLVPVFMPKFPATFFWWFHPNQLERKQK